MRFADAKAELLRDLRLLIEQSGDVGEFDLAGWLETWLKEPLTELSGVTPAQAIRTEGGRREVTTLLERMRGGLAG